MEKLNGNHAGPSLFRPNLHTDSKETIGHGSVELLVKHIEGKKTYNKTLLGKLIIG